MMMSDETFNNINKCIYSLLYIIIYWLECRSLISATLNDF